LKYLIIDPTQGAMYSMVKYLDTLQLHLGNIAMQIEDNNYSIFFIFGELITVSEHSTR